MSKHTLARSPLLLPCSADAAPIDMVLLGEHLACCKNSLGRMFRMRCLAESIRGFVAPRVVTTLLGVSALMLLGFTLA